MSRHRCLPDKWEEIMSRKPLILSLMSLLCVLALSGCGRKGALEPPPSTRIESGVETENGAPEQPTQQPDKPFILDRLIK